MSWLIKLPLRRLEKDIGAGRTRAPNHAATVNLPPESRGFKITRIRFYNINLEKILLNRHTALSYTVVENREIIEKNYLQKCKKNRAWGLLHFYYNDDEIISVINLFRVEDPSSIQRSFSLRREEERCLASSKVNNYSHKRTESSRE